MFEKKLYLSKKVVFVKKKLYLSKKFELCNFFFKILISFYATLIASALMFWFNSKIMLKF